ncbi:MAG: molybdate ABC transporter substrate-binding protein [Roseobacter sp.]
MKYVAPVFSLVVAGLMASVCAAQDVVVFAAASMKEAIEEIAVSFTEETGTVVRTSFAGSSTLARQIEFGAPADVFISANPAWMDQLADSGAVDQVTRVDLVGNSLVLIGIAKTAKPVTISANLDIDQLLQGGKLAMALVDAVPAGIYGKAALTHFGLWDHVKDEVAQADNVRAAMALVTLGATPAAIVYATDALADPRVAVLAEFPAQSHPPIVYPAALTTRARSLNAPRFLDYLQSPGADEVFKRYGFTVKAE